MMYKLLPFVAAVAAEEFMGRRMSTPTAPKSGEGFNVTGDGVKSTAHGYSAGDKLLLEVPSTCTGGKVQGGLTAGTEYTVVEAAAGVKANEFKLKNTATDAAVTITDATAHSECATWTQNYAVTANCGSLQTKDGGGTETAAAVGCAEKKAATTGTNAKAKHWEFTFADGHALATFRVRYTCGKTATNTPACLENMADGSYYTAAKVGDSTTKVTLKADGATADFDGGDTLTANKNAIAADTGAAAHSFQKVGPSWKSVTTTAKPAAGSSNFHVMVATVFSAFFYLMM